LSTLAGIRFSTRAVAGAGFGLLLGLLLLSEIIGKRFLGLSIADLGSLPEKIRALGPAGWLMFAGAQIVVAMLGILPASLLGIAAEATYGIALGFLLSAAGTLFGGWVAFWLSRSLLREWISARLANTSRRARLDAAIAQKGWRLVCLLRVSPVMPFAMTSYALGLTGISQRAYLLGTLAALPALLGYVTVGALAGMTLAGSPADFGIERRILLGLGILATVLLTLRIGSLLRTAGMLTPAVAVASPFGTEIGPRGEASV
jgi:uncharacterized membrane protein YdjX (TVP38/TMEM64 family)